MSHEIAALFGQGAVVCFPSVLVSEAGQDQGNCHLHLLTEGTGGQLEVNCASRAGQGRAGLGRAGLGRIFSRCCYVFTIQSPGKNVKQSMKTHCCFKLVLK